MSMVLFINYNIMITIYEEAELIKTNSGDYIPRTQAWWIKPYKDCKWAVAIIKNKIVILKSIDPEMDIVLNTIGETLLPPT